MSVIGARAAFRFVVSVPSPVDLEIASAFESPPVVAPPVSPPDESPPPAASPPLVAVAASLEIAPLPLHLRHPLSLEVDTMAALVRLIVLALLLEFPVPTFENISVVTIVVVGISPA